MSISDLTLLQLYLKNHSHHAPPRFNIPSTTALHAVLSCKNARVRARNQRHHYEFLSFRLERQVELARELSREEEQKSAKRGRGEENKDLFKIAGNGKCQGNIEGSQQHITNSQELTNSFVEYKRLHELSIFSQLKLDQNQQTRQRLSTYQPFLQHLTSLPPRQFCQACLAGEYLQSQPLSGHPLLSLFQNYFKFHNLPSSSDGSAPNELSFLSSECEKVLQEQQRKMQFQEGDFWSKMVFLMAKPQKYHNLIEINLKNQGQVQLASLFRKVTQGEAHSFSNYQGKKIQQTFFLMLQRQWKLNAAEGISYAQRIGLLCKQVHLKKLFKENYDEELKHLLDQGQLHLDLLIQEEEEYIKHVKQLLALGQMAKTVQLLEELGIFDPIQALLLLAPFKIRPKQTTLLYQQKHTDIVVQQLLANTTKQLMTSFLTLVPLFLSAFAPLLCTVLDQQGPFKKQDQKLNLKSFSFPETLLLSIVFLQLKVAYPSIDLRLIADSVNRYTAEIIPFLSKDRPPNRLSLGREANSEEILGLLKELIGEVEKLRGQRWVVRGSYFFREVLGELKKELHQRGEELEKELLVIQSFFEENRQLKE